LKYIQFKDIHVTTGISLKELQEIMHSLTSNKFKMIMPVLSSTIPSSPSSSLPYVFSPNDSFKWNPEFFVSQKRISLIQVLHKKDFTSPLAPATVNPSFASATSASSYSSSSLSSTPGKFSSSSSYLLESTEFKDKESFGLIFFIFYFVINYLILNIQPRRKILKKVFFCKDY
jgi:hypothetical protein